MLITIDFSRFELNLEITLRVICTFIFSQKLAKLLKLVFKVIYNLVKIYIQFWSFPIPRLAFCWWWWLTNCSLQLLSLERPHELLSRSYFMHTCSSFKLRTVFELIIGLVSDTQQKSSKYLLNKWTIFYYPSFGVKLLETPYI